MNFATPDARGRQRGKTVRLAGVLGEAPTKGEFRVGGTYVETFWREPPDGARRPATRWVVDLRDDAALDSSLTGSKAAALATAARGGLETLPGAVLTTTFSRAIDRGEAVEDHPALLDVYERAGAGAHPVVVRSSSPLEDTTSSSMAGQFESVIGVTGLAELAAAVRTVLDSRAAAGAPDEPIAVLVQPLLEPAFGGVLFGVDPVSGRTDRRIVSVVNGGPAPLVSGQVDGARYVLGDRGDVVDFAANDGPKLRRADLARLVALSDGVARVFGGPQDVEWAIDGERTLWLLQSRPVTTETRGVPRGPVFGPGPVAETFPEPLAPLEEDLWIPPLREAVREAVTLAGTATRAALEHRDVVVTVDGRVAIDLELAGEIVPSRGLLQKLNPVPPARRLRAAWRVGRLRAALPDLAEHLLDRVDADLAAVPALRQLTSRQLVGLLHRSQRVLRAVHAHEILIGMLTDTGHNRMTGASVALRVLVEGRRDGLSDAEILERSPAVLALAPPRVAPRPQLPPEADALPLGSDRENGNDNGILREALRLRVRWLQELSGRTAWELGTRLATSGQLAAPELVRHLSLEHLEQLATGHTADATIYVDVRERTLGEPLPARFQLSDLGTPIRAQSAGEVGSGTGAGGGTGTGQVTYDAANPPMGSVLVTTTLTPGLGPLLSRLNGIVAETGSVLSHLAILAREAHVATVVGYAGATDDLPEGTTVVVDGETGRVTIESGG